MKFQHYFRSRTYSIYIAMKAKEVVLDSLWRVLLIVLLPHKIAELFRKLLVTITQANSSGHLSKLLTAFLHRSIPGTASCAFGVSLAVSFGTNRWLNTVK